MTRFWISLPEAADFVLNMVKIMNGRELFIPKIPSMKITDLAKAIAPNCEQREIGIRPGEKLHEIMIPRDEAIQTLEFEKFYIITPAIKFGDDFKNSYLKDGKKVKDRFEYASDSNEWILSVEELKEIVKEFEEKK